MREEESAWLFPNLLSAPHKKQQEVILDSLLPVAVLSHAHGQWSVIKKALCGLQPLCLVEFLHFQDIVKGEFHQLF